MLHWFQLDEVAFNPSTTFLANLWNGCFSGSYQTPPSGVIIFCPETKSLNVIKLEKEKDFALLEKVKPGDIEKSSKQLLYLPTSLMDMVCMTQKTF